MADTGISDGVSNIRKKNVFPANISSQNSRPRGGRSNFPLEQDSRPERGVIFYSNKTHDRGGRGGQFSTRIKITTGGEGGGIFLLK